MSSVISVVSAFLYWRQRVLRRQATISVTCGTPSSPGLGVAGARHLGRLPVLLAHLAGLGQNVHRPGSGLARALALTYDDGPNDPWTLRLLDVLDRHSVKATFFVLGKFVAEKPISLRAIVAAGHELGIHTWDHPNLIFATPSALARRSNARRTSSSIPPDTAAP